MALAPTLEQPHRVIGIDVARGVASLIMIQGHAYHAWVSPEAKQGAGYAFTRLLGTLPLPAFLVLAGAAVMLRVQSAERRQESASKVRGQLIRRGFEVILWGYGTNVAYALMDGWQSAWTFLRADVLHVIGLGIVLLAASGVRAGRGSDAVDSSRLWKAAAGWGVGLTLLSPLVNGWVLQTPEPGGLGWVGWPLAALVLDVPSVTVMPLVPLGTWSCVGVVVAAAMARSRRESGGAMVAGAGSPFLLALGASSLVLSWLGSEVTAQLWGAGLSRSDIGIYVNVIDFGARGTLVLACAAGASSWLPERVRRVLVTLGQGSLYAYVFHIPFCYGAWGGRWRGSLSMMEASLGVIALSAASLLVVYMHRSVKRYGRASD